ncbi:MAG TPA: hypothetical protein PKL64_05770 [Bacteroidales bacterium]|nr:hypothetical protein [Bacteroidales bacterium]
MPISLTKTPDAMQKIIFFLICFFTVSGTIANAKTGNNPSEKY